jgi:hypothetical protein
MEKFFDNKSNTENKEDEKINKLTKWACNKIETYNN